MHHRGGSIPAGKYINEAASGGGKICGDLPRMFIILGTRNTKISNLELIKSIFRSCILSDYSCKPLHASVTFWDRRSIYENRPCSILCFGKKWEHVPLLMRPLMQSRVSGQHSRISTTCQRMLTRIMTNLGWQKKLLQISFIQIMDLAI